MFVGRQPEETGLSLVGGRRGDVGYGQIEKRLITKRACLVAGLPMNVPKGTSRGRAAGLPSGAQRWSALEVAADLGGNRGETAHELSDACLEGIDAC